MNEDKKLLIDFCLPIRDEEAILRLNLEKLLNYCQAANFNFSWRIIGLINGSKDSSVKILAEFKEKFPGLIDYKEIIPAGRGRALKEYWSESRADILVYMDVDLAVALTDIPALIFPIINKESDLTIGSRFIAGGKVKRSFNRELISKIYNFLSRFLLKYNIKDAQCGFKAIQREAFYKLQPYLLDNYWFFDTELIVWAEYLGYRVKEIPVDWRDNRFIRRASSVRILKDSWGFFKNLWFLRRRLKRLK
jgi:hypothetical protein